MSLFRLLFFSFLPTPRLTVFQLGDTVADVVDALVDLLMLALSLLPHGLSLLL